MYKDELHAVKLKYSSLKDCYAKEHEKMKDLQAQLNEA